MTFFWNIPDCRKLYYLGGHYCGDLRSSLAIQHYKLFPKVLAVKLCTVSLNLHAIPVVLIYYDLRVQLLGVNSTFSTNYLYLSFNYGL